jgi:hypothetical protein
MIMMMTPGLRRLSFTTHVTSSVGWVGAVMVFLALAIVGLVSNDSLTVRGVYVVMVPAAWFVLVPLAHASLLSGIVLSLGTTWGLFRHYWVVLKLLITIFATVILLIYMETFRQMAALATDSAVDVAVVRNASPMVHAILALILLLTATVLGVYKPFGLTAYGKRKQNEERQALPVTASARVVTTAAVQLSSTPSWLYVAAIIAVGLVLVIVVLHLTGTSFQH